MTDLAEILDEHVESLGVPVAEEQSEAGVAIDEEGGDDLML